MLNKRKIKREKEAEINFFEEFLKIEKHFFKDMLKKIRNVKDTRHQSYVEYQVEIILLVIILKNIFGIESMRSMTEKFNKKECIENINRLTGCRLEELPHYDTINNFMCKLDNQEVEKIRDYMIAQLFKKRSLEQFRLMDKYWTVIIDATSIFNFPKRHCQHCLKRQYKDKYTGEISREEYYHNVLEAKLVAGNMVLSLATEFIENEDENVSKQDCETKAFKRLAKKLKEKYPKLPICILADSLYASNPVMQLCKSNKWKYIIRFKDGSIPTLAEEFETIRKIEGFKGSDKFFVNEIEYRNEKINMAYATFWNKKKDKQTSFKYITNIKVTQNNFDKIIAAGRNRWKIENEGFNNQKTKRYKIEHANSLDYNAMKNHYLITQMADIMRQLYEKGAEVLKNQRKTIKEISSNLLETFRIRLLTENEDNNPLCKNPIRIRFLNT